MKIASAPILAIAISFAVLAGGLTVSSQAAGSGTLAIAIKDDQGMPVRDAVVMVYPATGIAGGSFKFDGNGVMQQRNIQFDPGTLIVAKGTNVSFPNRDRVRHNVYSFSEAGKFEMKLYGKDESRSQRFSIVGTVALGCNIHDEMKGYIKVVDTPYAAKTDHNGLLQIGGLPAGFARVKVWHPNNRVRGGETEFSFPINGSGLTKKTMTLKLRK
ncbi:methylamine utilization protein [Parasphingorhabdus sp.]|uniref:methylamine utilization protein n=1 Tax=Parasphingorhabdus sp. TaxID=2709688 RepID=UPI0030034891